MHGDLSHIWSAMHSMESTIHHMRDDVKSLTRNCYNRRVHNMATVITTTVVTTAAVTTMVVTSDINLVQRSIFLSVVVAVSATMATGGRSTSAANRADSINDIGQGVR